METNPYKYDRTQPWTPPQKQLYQNRSAAQNEQQLIQSQNQKVPQRNVGQKPGTQVKMPKARALAMANSLKRSLAVASIIGFGMFGGLVAMHQVGTTTTQSTQSTSGSSNTSSNSSSSSQNSNAFLNQKGGNTSGTSSSSTNSSSSSSSSSTPVTGTSTS
jgi:cytoskeletal protein RodZ